MPKKNAPLFGASVPPNCLYCENNLVGKDPAVCRFGLEPPQKGTCKRYRYNPMLRQPKAQPPLPEFDPDEFKL